MKLLHWFILFTFLVFTVYKAGAADVSQTGVVVEKTGSVLYFKTNQPAIPAEPNQQLNYEDKLRTLESSQATVRLADLTECRMRELSTLEILPPPATNNRPVLNLIHGALYFFSREKPRDVQVQTPHGIGGARGTEFEILVESNRSTFILFDGMVELSNSIGSVMLTGHEAGIIEDGVAPRKVAIESLRIVQWWLYYPGVLDPNELNFTPDEKTALATSLTAYRAGDLLRAVQEYPTGRTNGSSAEQLYRAQLLLAVGEVGKAETLLNSQPTDFPLATALRTMISAVTSHQSSRPPPRTASEQVALSYLLQSQFRLAEALEAARAAVAQSPQFGFGWERVAELEFSFGRIKQSVQALDKSLALAPRNAQAHALKGFLLCAENRITAAVAEFELALQIDNGLANAWLGRGLCRIKRGDSEGERADLQTAVVLEPNRSLLRSYLGKAFSNVGDDKRANQELALAKQLDEKDPTPWLYSALLDHQENRMGQSVQSLEESVALNDNRRVYRSKLMLDQDRAVGSTSLAKVYQAAGLDVVSVQEATRAVNYDYGNYSAHLFLADSLNALRDPTRFNLRYETPWFNELLLANLLAPVGVKSISQGISQQEYSRLFEQDGLGMDTTSSYRSDGQYRETASQYGTFGRTSYSMDLDYQHNDGTRPNNKLSRIEWYSQIKQQIGPQDAVFVMAKYQDYSSGDNFQYYNPTNVRRNFHFNEYQTPLIVGAYHHEWSPGVHTLALAGRLENDQQVSDKNIQSIILSPNGPGTYDFQGFQTFDDLTYESHFETYTAELNQIFQGEYSTLVVGGRYQNGQFSTSDTIHGVNPASLTPFFTDPPAKANLIEDFQRINVYLYHTLTLFQNLLITTGVTYDQMTYPDNFRFVPITPGTAYRDQVSPKLALSWTPRPEVTFRGAYSRALSGVSFDESFRLEPTQLAGFNQAYRSIVSESVVGSLAGQQYTIVGGAMDVKFKSRTYLTFQVQQLKSDANENIGVFYYNGGISPPASVFPGSSPEELNYREISFTTTINQLLGNEWSVGTQYSYTHSSLGWNYPTITGNSSGLNRTESADLNLVNTYLLFVHPSGFRARAETQWYLQSNYGYTPVRPQSDFVMVNLSVGYSFWRQRGEATVGILNLTGQDYRLNPLNVYNEMPHDRVFQCQLRLNF